MDIILFHNKKMDIRILKAYNGDSFLLSFSDEEDIRRNVLIDGGTSQTYQHKNLKNKLENGDLKKTIDEIESKNEHIDLLVLTHIDDDHIGGLLKWIESNRNFEGLVKKVWFNSGSLIAEKLNKSQVDYNTKIKILDGQDTSVKQGINFENYISHKNLWYKELIIQKNEHKFYNLTFQILTPAIKRLEKLLADWNLKKSEALTSKTTDYKFDISELLESNIFEEDKATYNGSSISFNIKYKDINLLFLSDAFPSDIVTGLKQLGYSETKKIKAEYVKISHHGSKNNTSTELLSYIDSSNYIISSNGNIHNLPDKISLARIVNMNSGANLMFNYPEMINKIFSENDYKEYNFKTTGITKNINV